MRGKGMGRTARVSAFVVLLLALSVLPPLLLTQSGPTRVHDAIWLAESDRVTVIATDSGETLFELAPVGEIRALTLDDELSIAWTLETERASGPPGRGRGGPPGRGGSEAFSLRAYDFDGTRLMGFELDWASSLEGLKAEPGFAGRLWLRDESHIHVFDADLGERIASRELPGAIAGMALDGEDGRLFVATEDDLRVMDRDGEWHAAPSLSLNPDESIRHLAWAADAQAVWLATDERVLRLDDNGQSHDFAPSGMGSVRGIAPDGQGGIWLARPAWLSRYDASGLERTSLQPFAGYPGAGGTQGLVSDASEPSVWPHSRRHVRQFDSDGVPGHEATIAAMNGELIASVVFADRIPPELDIHAPADGSYHNDPELPIRLDWFDIGTGVDEDSLKFELNGEEWTPDCDTAVDGADCRPATALDDGEYQLTATVADFSGNVSETAETGFMIDTVAPTLMVQSPVDGSYSNDPRTAIELQWSDGGSGVDSDSLVLEKNQQAWAANCSTDAGGADCVPASDLPEGEHHFTARVYDRAGNASDQVEVSVTVDTIAPEVSILSPDAGALLNDPLPALSLEWQDEGVGVDVDSLTVQLNGGEWPGSCQAGESAGECQLDAPLEDGEYTITVAIADLAGNVSESAELAFVVDTQPPEISFVSPAPGSIHGDPQVSVELNWSDEGSGVDPNTLLLEKNGAGWTADCETSANGAVCTAPGGFDDGEIQLTARVSDHAGNVSDAVSLGFLIDTQPPAISLESPTVGEAYNEPERAFVINWSDPYSGVDPDSLEIQLNGAALAVTCDSDGSGAVCHPQMPLPDGDHEIRVQVADHAGNQSEPAEAAFIVDTQPPSLAIDSPQLGEARNDANQPLLLSWSDALSGVDIESLALSLNGESLAVECDATEQGGSCQPLSPLPDGHHVLAAEISDRAGNRSETVSVDFVVDTQAPTITLESPQADEAHNQPERAIEISWSDEVSGVEGDTLSLALNGQSLAASCEMAETGATCHPTSPLADGDHQLTVQVADRAGNLSDPASAAFLIDTQPPSLAIDSPQSGEIHNQPERPVLLHWSDSLSGVDPDSLALTLNGQAWTPDCDIDGDSVSCQPAEPIADGEHQLTAVIHDQAGNSSETVVAFTLDTAAPELWLEAPESAYSTDPDQVFVLAWAAEGSAVVAESLSVSLAPEAGDAEALELDCEATEEDVTCVPAEALSDGVYTLEAQVNDLAGNSPEEITHTLTVDTVAPELTLVSPQDGQADNDASLPLLIEWEDEASGVDPDSLEILIDDQPRAFDCEVEEDGAECQPESPFMDGEYELAVAIADRAGNRTELEPVAFEIDTRAPEITLARPEQGEVFEQEAVEVTGSLDQPATLTVNGETVSLDPDFGFTHTLRLSLGEHRITVHAQDAAGNTAQTTRDILREEPAPEIELYSPAQGLITQLDYVQVQARAENAESVFIDGEGVTLEENGYFQQLVSLVNGRNEIPITARSESGAETRETLIVHVTDFVPGVDNQRIYVEEDEDGNKRIIGQPGAVPPGATVTLRVTGTASTQSTTLTVVADERGAFEIAVPADMADADDFILDVSASDEAGDRQASVQIASDSAPGDSDTPAHDPDELGLPDDDRPIVPGETEVETSVSKQGAANIKIPIHAVRGPGGMTPEVALAYDSRGGNGHLGVGWSLSGLSTISRCPQTIAQDGAPGGVAGDADDRFCMNGQRLMVVGGEYGASGSEYRTEIESYSRIEAKGSQGGGPASFRVVTNNGLIEYYGGHEGDNVEFDLDDGPRWEWPIRRIEDRYGNYIDFEYKMLSDDQAGIDYYIKEIRYGSEASGEDAGKLVFEYEDRPDRYATRRLGTLFKMYDRLAAIRSYSSGALAREYTLGYAQDPDSGQSRLQAIRECSDISCFLPVEFSWDHRRIGVFSAEHEPPPNRDWPEHEVASGNFSGTGRVDTVYDTSDGLRVLFGQGGTRTLGFHCGGSGWCARRTVTADVTGDGKTELISPRNDADYLRIHRVGESFHEEIDTIDIGSDVENIDQVIAADLNATGIPEILVSIDNELRVYSKNHPSDSYAFHGVMMTGVHPDDRFTPADIRPNGRMELVKYRSGCPSPGGTDPGNGGGTDPDPPGGPGGPTNPNSLNSSDSLDITGSGCLMYFELSEGLGSAVQHDVPRSQPDQAIQSVAPVDLTGNGLADIVIRRHHYDGIDSWEVRLNDGYGEDWSRTAFPTHLEGAWEAEVGAEQYGDITGDGRTNILVRSDGKWWVLGFQDVAVDGTVLGLGFLEARELDIDVPAPLGHSSLFRLGDYQGYGEVNLLVNLSDGPTLFTDGGLRHGAIDRIGNALGGFVRFGYTRSTFEWAQADADGDVNDISYPKFVLNDPATVVHSLQHSTGILSDQSQSAPNDVLYTHYRYGKRVADRHGRGLLGVSRMETSNSNTDIRSINEMRLDFPFSGMIERSWQVRVDSPIQTISADAADDDFDCIDPNADCWDGPPGSTIQSDEPGMLASSGNGDGTGDVIVEDVSHELDALIPEGLDESDGVYFAYVRESVEKVREINDGNLRSVTIRSYDYNGWGSIDYSLERTETGSGGLVHQVELFNDYDQWDDDRWCLNRLTSARAEHSLPGQPDMVRESSFGYDPSTCALTRETQGGIDPSYSEEVQAPQRREKITEYAYDEWGNRKTRTVSGTGVEARTSERDYGLDGRFRRSTVNPLGHASQTTWDTVKGLPLAETDANGLTVTHQYDGFGRKTYEQGPEPGTWVSRGREWCGSNCTRSEAVYRVEEVASDGGRAWAEVDTKRRRILEGESGWEERPVVSESYYDSLGRVWLQRLPGWADAEPCWVQTKYDALGRTRFEAQPAGAQECGQSVSDFSNDTLHSGLSVLTESEFRVESGLSVTRGTDPEGRVVERHEDARGQLVKIVNGPGGIGATTHMVRDALGNVTVVTPPSGEVVRLRYDALGHKREMDDPDMGTWLYEHDALGQLTRQEDARGQVIEIKYDQLGRRLTRTEPEGITRWRWDGAEGAALGQLDSVSQGDDYERGHVYDDFGRPILTRYQFDGAEYHTTQTYDDQGRLLTRQVTPVSDGQSGFTVNHSYSAGGHLASVASPQSDEVYWQAESVDAQGRVTESSLGNGLRQHRELHKIHGGLLSTRVMDSGQALVSQSYEWNHVGHVTERIDEDAGITEHYQYDALGRIETVTGEGSDGVFDPAMLSESIEYDLAGNIESRSRGWTDYDYGSDSHAHAQPHAVSSVSRDGESRTLAYDANGNMTQAGDREITWSSFNKPTRIREGTVRSDFRYGPDRDRYYHRAVLNSSETRITHYVGGHYERIEKHINFSLQRVHRFYVQAGGQVVAVVERDQSDNSEVQSAASHRTEYWHRDHQGSVIAVTDQNGELSHRFRYDTWGQANQWGEAPTGTAGAVLGVIRGYTGHEHLEHLGLIHMNGRVYDPDLGRFLSPDPFVQFPESTQGYNRYTYVGNNPISMTDPSGYFLRTVAGVALSASGVGIVGSALIMAAVGYAETGSVQGAIMAGASAAIGGIAGGINDGFIHQAMFSAISQGVVAAAVGADARTAFAGSLGSSLIGQGAGRLAEGRSSPTLQTIIVASGGGLGSRAAGGSFTNGAVSAAFAYAFGRAAQSEAQQGGPNSGSEPVDIWGITDQVDSALDAHRIALATDQASEAIESHLNSPRVRNPRGHRLTRPISNALWDFAEHVGRDIEVVSGYRSQARQDEIRRSGNPRAARYSPHTYSDAADIRVQGLSAREASIRAYNSGVFNRVNYYTTSNAIHVDMQDGVTGYYGIDWHRTTP